MFFVSIQWLCSFLQQYHNCPFLSIYFTFATTASHIFDRCNNYECTSLVYMHLHMDISVAKNFNRQSQATNFLNIWILILRIIFMELKCLYLQYISLYSLFNLIFLKWHVLYIYRKARPPSILLQRDSILKLYKYY